MKIKCQRDKLFSAFQTAAMFAPGRSPKAILQNVKLIASKDEVTLMGTDMEVGVRVHVEGVEVEGPGSAVLPVGNFGSILRESTDDVLALDADANGTVIRGSRSEFKLPGADPDEFPNVASFEAPAYHAIAAPAFKEMISRTEFATEVESTRYALGGVLIEFEPAKITAVGTDGRRLARQFAVAESVGGHKGPDSNTIVRTQSMRLIGRALADSDEFVHISARANDILVRTPRATFYSRLVEGRFPRWRDVFPQRTDSVKLNLVAGQIHTALKQAAIACNNDSRGIDTTLSNGTLILAAATADLGQARVEMPIAYDGETIVVRLDHRFLTDFLKVLSPEQVVTLDIENGETAAVFSVDDGNYGYVVMPLSRDSAT